MQTLHEVFPIDHFFPDADLFSPSTGLKNDNYKCGEFRCIPDINRAEYNNEPGGNRYNGCQGFQDHQGQDAFFN